MARSPGGSYGRPPCSTEVSAAKRSAGTPITSVDAMPPLCEQA